MSFGRKGLAPREHQSAAIPARRAVADTAQSAQVAAFLAAERSRAAELGIPSTRYHEPAAGRMPEPDVLAGLQPAGPRKSLALAYVLWWFGYAFAAHRFYLGDTSGAVKQCGLFLGSLAVMLLGAWSQSSPVVVIGVLGLCTASGWLFVDMFRIPAMCRRANAWADSPQRYFD